MARDFVTGNRGQHSYLPLRRGMISAWIGAKDDAAAVPGLPREPVPDRTAKPTLLTCEVKGEMKAVTLYAKVAAKQPKHKGFPKAARWERSFRRTVRSSERKRGSKLTVRASPHAALARALVSASATSSGRSSWG